MSVPQTLGQALVRVNLRTERERETLQSQPGFLRWRCAVNWASMRVTLWSCSHDDELSPDHQQCGAGGALPDSTGSARRFERAAHPEDRVRDLFHRRLFCGWGPLWGARPWPPGP